jgi:hypothetical protein
VSVAGVVAMYSGLPRVHQQNQGHGSQAKPTSASTGARKKFELPPHLKKDVGYGASHYWSKDKIGEWIEDVTLHVGVRADSAGGTDNQQSNGAL